jgi:hypothetical protein
MLEILSSALQHTVAEDLLLFSFVSVIRRHTPGFQILY